MIVANPKVNRVVRNLLTHQTVIELLEAISEICHEDGRDAEAEILDVAADMIAEQCCE